MSWVKWWRSKFAWTLIIAVVVAMVGAFAADFSIKIKLTGMEMTIGESLSQNESFALAKEITKDEFYDLTT